MLNDSSIMDIDIVRFNNVLTSLPKRTDIRFIGAEPTMNPQLFDLIKTVRSHGHRPSLLTNGLRLRRGDYMQALKAAGLNMLGLSMNGGLNDDVYQEFDNGRYAKSKTTALDNCFKYNILPHINIIIDPTNIHVIPELIDYIAESALRHERRFGRNKFPVMLRLKSIGQIGIYRKTYTYSLQEMVEVMSQWHDVETTNIIDGYNERRTVLYTIDTIAGPLYIKLTDWSVDDDGVPDAGSKRRGILTDNYKITPFFEFYVKHHNETL
jgi:sulfatase maturation enzyme AslB (radical SAM superfamily)